MKFDLVDDIIDRTPERIVAVKQVSRAEEYLGDHFPGFPVLPGVMMIESMVQAARLLLADRCEHRLVLGGVKALRFGSMVRPGQTLLVEVTAKGPDEDGSFACRGVGSVVRFHAVEGGPVAGGAAGETAVSGRFTMRPIRVPAPA